MKLQGSILMALAISTASIAFAQSQISSGGSTTGAPAAPNTPNSTDTSNAAMSGAITRNSGGTTRRSGSNSTSGLASQPSSITPYSQPTTEGWSPAVTYQPFYSSPFSSSATGPNVGGDGTTSGMSSPAGGADTDGAMSTQANPPGSVTPPAQTR